MDVVLLAGMFEVLCDGNLERRKKASKDLTYYLYHIKNSLSVKYGTMAGTVIRRAGSSHAFIRLLAITWIDSRPSKREFLNGHEVTKLEALNWISSRYSAQCSS